MVRTDTATGWGSDTLGIKVYKISKVSLSIGGKRLTKYENSADTPIYYRGDSDVYPVFFVDVEVEGATLSKIKHYIQVFININDYTKIRDPIHKKANYESDISKYKADWKNSPNDYPVGKYNVTAEVKDSNGNLLASSEKKHFYLIFKSPKDKKSFVDVEFSAENLKWDCKDKYVLHQFQYRNWKPVLEKITGSVSIDEAARTLLLFSHGIDDSDYGFWHAMCDESTKCYENDPTHKFGDFVCGHKKWSRNYDAYGYYPKFCFPPDIVIRRPVYAEPPPCPRTHKSIVNAWWHDVNDFLDSDYRPNDPNGNCPRRRPMGVCVDYAALFISNLRSAGIPAREVSGKFWSEGGHAWVEVFNGNDWVHADPTWYWNSITGRIFYNAPDVYSNERGYYPTEVLTRKNSPKDWFAIRKEGHYRYVVQVTIDFDSVDYDYGDTVTADISVKNIGDFDIEKPLYLATFDNPTGVHKIGHTRPIATIKIGKLKKGESHSEKISYQLPDCSPNWWCELGGSRELIAQVVFEATKLVKKYNNCYSKIQDVRLVGEQREKVPGLCFEWNPQIMVNSLVITLNTANATSFSFNETKNESTERFVKPQNASVTVEHKIKYYTDYTRENWYIFNPNNNTHDYNLITPLLGIGNAVYIPGYGSITANQSVDTSAGYIVIYNTTTGTNGTVDIYAFSRNITLKNITILNGIVKVVGTWNTSLAGESGISYLLYFSTRNGNEMSFDEIYRSFAREVVNKEDSLTHFYIEGEDRQIPYYKLGDVAYINVKVKNNGVLPETRNINLTITEPGLWGSKVLVYNTTKTVTVPAASTTTVTFQYQIPDTSIGWHGVKVSDGIARAETIFIVRAPFNVTFDIPPNVTQSEEFYVNATIKNELDITLSEINVTIDLPNDFNTSENLTKFVGTLSSGESAKVSWLVTATDFEYGYAPFTLYIDSAEGIRYIASAYTNVLRLPELRIYPSVPSEVRVNVPFILRVNVTNEGDLGMNNVSIRLYLPDNVTTNDSLTKSIGDLETGEVKTIVWEITSMRDSDFWINFDGWDESRTYYDNATIFINIVKPEITLSLTTPFEVIANQSFYIIANVKNTGEINATPVIVSLILPSEFETANNTSVTIENIASGEAKELKWMLKGVNAGYGEIEVRANNASVRRGIIVSDFPLTVKTDKDVYLQGENVMINSNVSNRNPEVSYVDLRMNITIQGQGINETKLRKYHSVGTPQESPQVIIM